MATPLTTSFSRYELTQEEELSGQVLTLNQIYVTQNEMSNIAEQIIRLDFDPTNPQEYYKQKSFLNGQLSILQLRIDQHDAARIALTEIAQINSELQSQN